MQSAKYFVIAITFVLSLWSTRAYAQLERDEIAMIEQFKGLQVMAKDSTFYINFRFRMQNRLAYYTKSGSDFSVDRWEMRVRRLRLRFDGFIISPKLAYSIQLSFSRGDQDFENSGVANIVRDAIIYYKPHPRLHIGFGLNKLPGNRQRVNSSGQLQFADRSIVNATFNIDRDYGVKIYYYGNIGKFGINLKGAITSGEGRSANFTNGGLAYTGRLELLPMGNFTGDGDYSEGDLEREPKPKLAIGGGYSFNHKAQRTGGQTGPFLYDERDITTMYADLVFKWQGFAYQFEYMQRESDMPYTFSDEGAVRHIYNGQGINNQFSYVFPSMYEIVFRYSWVNPFDAIEPTDDTREVLELGATKYLRKHRVKVQLSVLYDVRDHNFSLNNPKNSWGSMFQVELGI